MNVATFFGKPKFVGMLLKRGVTPDTPNKAGNTALGYSISQNHPEVEMVLRAAGAE